MSRTEAIRQVMIWPGWPPRGSILSMSSLHFYRISCHDDCWHFGPRDPEKFLEAVSRWQNAATAASKASPSDKTSAVKTDLENVAGKPAWPVALPWISRAGIVFAVVATLVALILPAWISAHKRPSAQQPIFYTFAGFTSFAKGPEGPVPSDAFIKKMGFTPAQVGELNPIITAYYREFVSIERRHTKVSRDSRGHVLINIAPFPDESLALAKRLAAELRGVLGRDIIPQEPERGSLMQIGLFRHCGEFTVAAELWKENGRYHFRENLTPAAGVPQPPMGRESSGVNPRDAFPEEYWVYWIESSSGFPTATSAPAVAGLGAAEILHKMEKKYDSLLSFSATGKTVSEVSPAAGGAPVSTEHAFTIKLARPDFYRIEWAQQVDMGFTKFTMKGAVWYSGKEHSILIAEGQVGKLLNRELALSSATGVSGGAAHRVPNLFFKDKPLVWINSLKNPSRQPDEKVGNEDCYVIAADFHGKEILWITKKDFFLKQIRSVSEAKPGKAVAPDASATSDDNLKKTLKMLGQEATPEAVSKMRKSIEDTGKMAGQFRATTTQTFLKIVADEIMEKEDFEYPVPSATR